MKALLLLLVSLPAFTQTAQLSPMFRQQWFTATGAVASGYKVCSYQAGTSTPLATYTDQTGTVANTNPVILDSTGSGNVWLLNRSYKLVLMTPGTDTTCSTGSVVKSVDNVQPFYRYQGTAAPVTGTYQTGDFVWNTTPTTSAGSASAVLGWLCTAGGTPGTWTAVSGTLGDHIPRSVTVDQNLTVTGTSLFSDQIRPTANVFAVASDFTTANNTNLQTITGLSWVLAANLAQNVPFHCSLAYSQATANAAVAFGIQSATISPTNIFAIGMENTSPTAGTQGVLATLSSTTATSIVSATPGATATNYRVELDGYIENPSNASPNTINIMVSTATGADAVTVKRGGWCRIW